MPGDQTSKDAIVNALMRSMNQERYGLNPYDPRKNSPQDIGLGGPSTEYSATAEDQSGYPFNYPQIWWDMFKQPHLLQGDDAYNQSMGYEDVTGKRFPRFSSMGQAEFDAENRSALGGGDLSPFATDWRTKKW